MAVGLHKSSTTRSSNAGLLYKPTRPTWRYLPARALPGPSPRCRVECMVRTLKRLDKLRIRLGAGHSLSSLAGGPIGRKLAPALHHARRLCFVCHEARVIAFTSAFVGTSAKFDSNAFVCHGHSEIQRRTDTMHRHGEYGKAQADVKRAR